MFSGAKLSFTNFTDDELVWETKDDINEFFSDIRVVPANEEEYGAVKQAETLSFEETELVNGDSVHIVINEGEAEEAEAEVPTLASFSELKTAFNTLQASYNDLLTKLKVAGIVAND